MIVGCSNEIKEVHYSGYTIDKIYSCGGYVYEATTEPIYQWVEVSLDEYYICSGTTQYRAEKEQVSYDNGVTWEDVTPVVYRVGRVLASDSIDCGYIPSSTKLYIKTTGCGETSTVQYQSYNDSKSTLNPTDIGSLSCYTTTVSAVVKWSVTKFAEGALMNLRQLQTITIGNDLMGSSLTEIGAGAFEDDYRLTRFVIKASTPPSLANDAFLGCDNLKYIYVPSGSVNAYKQAPGWSNFSDIIYPIT